MNERQRSSRFDRSDDIVVMKFGGTSVEDAAAIQRLIAIVQSRSEAQPVVVVSALAGVTDQLLEAGKAAAQGHLGAALSLVREIYIRHERMADDLVSSGLHGILDRELRCELRELEALLRDLEASRSLGHEKFDREALDLRTQDRLLGFGECLSSRLVRAALCEAGVNAAHVDARSCIVTDGRHGQANPLWDATNQRLQDYLSPILESRQGPVLGGFIAATEDCIPTTLGRGGSDFSAAIIGAAVGAARIEIWTDVDGVMTADPKICPDARVIRRMSFDEAAEMAHFGAKVLHPATLTPAVQANIPVFVLNSRRPQEKGTEIAAHAASGDVVSAIAAKRKVASVEVNVRKPFDSDLLRAVSAVFDRHHCPVDILTTTLGRLSLLVRSDANLSSIAADLQGLDRESLGEVRWENHQALVSLIGKNVCRRPDVASRAFAAMSDMNVRMVCPGASGRTISFLVEESNAAESVRRLHAEFFAEPKLAHDWGGDSSAYCQAG
jgi:aspartate kinase